MSYANNNYQSNYQISGSGRSNYQNKQNGYQNGNQSSNQNSYQSNNQNSYKNSFSNNFQSNPRNKYENQSTQIRNLYSKGMASMTLSFFKSNLSILLRPYVGAEQNEGRLYAKEGIMTTVNHEGASALWLTCRDIIAGLVETTILTLQCTNNTTITLEKKAPGEIYLVISKDNKVIPFKFASTTMKVKDDNGIVTTVIVESGLGVFMMTTEAYLLATNASAHFAKLGEGFESQQE